MFWSVKSLNDWSTNCTLLPYDVLGGGHYIEFLSRISLKAKSNFRMSFWKVSILSLSISWNSLSSSWLSNWKLLLKKVFSIKLKNCYIPLLNELFSDLIFCNFLFWCTSFSVRMMFWASFGSDWSCPRYLSRLTVAVLILLSNFIVWFRLLRLVFLLDDRTKLWSISSKTDWSKSPYLPGVFIFGVNWIDLDKWLSRSRLLRFL